MRARVSMESGVFGLRSLWCASLVGLVLLGGMPAAALAGDAREASSEPAEGERPAALSEAEQTAAAYRAVFDRLPTDLEALEHVPSGRGLDSWKLFVDHPELAALADALVAISDRKHCDFGGTEQLEPSIEHHKPYNRAKNLLLHRVVTKLLGDRTVAPDDFGRMPDDVGVDEPAATRYAVAMLNMSVHFSERGTLAERRFAATAAPDLMGVARRAPQGLPWAMDALRTSRYLEPLENLFGYQDAAIARLQLLARTIKEEPERFIEVFGLTPPDGNRSSPLFAATLERHRWAYGHAAETLKESWDIENPTLEVLTLLRSMPSDLPLPRSTVNEIMRSVAEVSAVREDVRAMLKAFPAEEPSDDHAAENGEESDDGAADD